MDARMIVIGQVTLAPVVLGVVLALVRGGTGRVVPALAVAALALLIVGLSIYDAQTGLRSGIAYYRTLSGSTSFSQAALILSGASVIHGAGATLLVAATALALHDAARARLWRWFAALLVAQLLAAIFTAALNQMFWGFYGTWPGADLFQRVNEGDLSVSVPYYLVTSALLAASPVVALLYGLRARLPAPADAASAGTTAAA